MCVRGGVGEVSFIIASMETNVMLLPVISSVNFSFGLRDRVTSCHRCSIWWLFYTARANRFVLLWSVKQKKKVGSHQNIRDVHTGQ